MSLEEKRAQLIIKYRDLKTETDKPIAEGDKLIYRLTGKKGQKLIETSLSLATEREGMKERNKMSIATKNRFEMGMGIKEGIGIVIVLVKNPAHRAGL